MHITTRVAGTAGALVLSLGALAAPATASDGAPEPCAQQQAQVDRATGALARVTAVFERQRTKVRKAKKDVAQADTARERRGAERDLARAKDARDETAVAKKAQQQRLARAQARLDACRAEQPAA